MPFENAHPTLATALAERGYAEPTPVQAAVLQADAHGRDLLVSAQTGSGKTVAFGLAVAPELLDDAGALVGPAGAPLALVIAPTRELALQVHAELGWLYAPAKARLASCVGGMDMGRERRTLAHGVHIVVGTPGRLRDHLERGNLDLSQLRAVVLDEADEMLDLGFREDLEFILDATPAERRRTLLFSATIPREIASLAKSYQKDAFRIATQAENQAHGDIEYRAVLIAPNEAEHAVVNLLRYFESRGALVFCSTRESVRHLYANLLERGFAVVALSGELSQNERTRAMQMLRDARARVCVATDVAARGIDLPDLGLVIHAELPQNRDTLLHRSGRTGRAGRKGTSVLLVPYNRRRRAEALLGAARVDAVWSVPPTSEQIRERDQERLKAEISAAAAEPAAEEDLAAARALLAERGAEEVAAVLVRLQRARLPAPEVVFDDTEERPAAEAPPPRPGPRPRDEARPPRPAPVPRARPSGPDGEGGGASGPPVWFRMNVGRRDNADPRWLVPLICRRGRVVKQDIGAIRILERETKFEIAPDAADRFAAASRQSAGAGGDGEVRIEPAAAPPAERPARVGPPPPQDGHRDRPAAGSAPSGETLRLKGRPDGLLVRRGRLAPPRPRPGGDDPVRRLPPPRRAGPPR